MHTKTHHQKTNQEKTQYHQDKTEKTTEPENERRRRKKNKKKKTGAGRGRGVGVDNEVRVEGGVLGQDEENKGNPKPPEGGLGFPSA